MTARFGLPQPETAAPAEASPTEAPVAWATAREILLVEDEAINREIGLYFLTDAGFRVTVAEDGLEAVELAGQHRYDLILMDLQMPRLDGLEAARRIRASEEGLRVPIIALTANAFAEDRERCLAVGMDDFISKPFLPETLLACLQRHLAQAAAE